MKAKLLFDLNDADDYKDHQQCIMASNMASVLFEIWFNMKKKVEWKIDESEFENQQECLDYVFKQISELIYDKGITENLLL